MTVVAYTEHLKVNATHRVYNRVVSSALCLGIFCESRGEVGVLLININVIEEILVHKVCVALVVGGLEAYVLVKVDRAHVLEGYLTRGASSDKLLIHLYR